MGNSQGNMSLPPLICAASEKAPSAGQSILTVLVAGEAELAKETSLTTSETLDWSRRLRFRIS